MSDIYLKLTVANINDPERQQEVSFLVDTGATRAWVSKEIAEAVGIELARTVPLELADGSITERPYGFCLFVYTGEIVAGNVVIGPPKCEPLVGTHVLQDFRMIVDLEHYEVTRGRAMRAKRGSSHCPDRGTSRGARPVKIPAPAR
ncbi:MAG: aspartyl protease family protein [Candidatus Bipolaricaulia bacterium]